MLEFGSNGAGTFPAPDWNAAVKCVSMNGGFAHRRYNVAEKNDISVVYHSPDLKHIDEPEPLLPTDN